MASKPPNIPLPKAWSSHIKAGILHVISLARVALVAASGRAAQSGKANIRLRAELAEARGEISQLEEELRLKVGGRTPHEIYNDAKSLPPVVDTRSPVELVVHYHEGRRELPIVELKNAA